MMWQFFKVRGLEAEISEIINFLFKLSSTGPDY